MMDVYWLVCEPDQTEVNIRERAGRRKQHGGVENVALRLSDLV